jgi:hypothetical protein
VLRTCGNWGIDENEIADQLARQGSSHPLIGPQPAFGISARVVRGVIRDSTHRKHDKHWLSTGEQRQAKGFLKRSSSKRAKELLSLS